MTENKLDLSDWLLASDIDGTLNNKRRRLPLRNKEAINKFVYEHGGNFILASGRSIESMRKHFEKLHLNHGYAVFINGAGVYDYTKEKILWVSYINEKTEKLIKKTVKKFPRVKIMIITATETRLFKPGISEWILALSSRYKQKRYKSIDDIPTGDWCKVIFTGLPRQLDKVQRYVEQENNKVKTNLMRSSICSYEIVNEDTNKGVAVLKVAEILGIDKSKTAAIGDYFNDYEMLKSVALPACCGQAPEGMKEVAKLVTCHCDKGAVADLIEYIIANKGKIS